MSPVVMLNFSRVTNFALPAHLVMVNLASQSHALQMDVAVRESEYVLIVVVSAVWVVSMGQRAPASFSTWYY